MTIQTARCPRCGEAFPEGLAAEDFEGICPNCLAFLAVDDADVVPSASLQDPMKLAANRPPPPASPSSSPSSRRSRSSS